LVHIVCHDKGAHSDATCDPSKSLLFHSSDASLDFRENLVKVPQLAGLSASF
jgi:hypothetical protein